MLFLTKSSSARRTLLAVLLALCCLSCVLGAKITKKAEKQPANNNVDKAEEAETIAAAEAAAVVAVEAENSNKDEETEDNEEADEEEEDDDDDEDDDEEEAAPAVKQKKQKKQPAKANKDSAVAATTNNNKNELQPATDVTIWGMVRTLWGWLRADLGESLFGDDDDEKPTKVAATVEGRTFGKIRRLQMALIPIIFKFGVLSAMVAFLVAIGMKSLFLLKVLVLMNAFAILGKFLTLKTSLFGQFENSAPSFNYPSWNSHAKESWAPTGLSNSGPPAHPPSKEIHLHIHGNAQTQAQLADQGYSYDQGNQGWASRSDPYSAYPTGQFQTQIVQQPQPQPQPIYSELPNNTNPINLLPTKYPARNLIR